MSSFGFKQLRVTFILAGTNQVFAGTNSNTLVLTGLRTQAKVESVARQSTTADVKVYGMLPADMAALTVAWANPPVVLDHIVIVEANDGNGWTLVFKGTIIEAQPEFRGSPSVYFHAAARTGYFQQIQAAEPTSYQGSVTIGQIATDLTKRMGFALIDGGAEGSLSNPYLEGTLYDQLARACEATQTDYYFIDNSVLITKAGKPRKDQPTVVLDETSGLVGYPVYERAGLNVTAIFNPAFLCGTPIDLTSLVPNATGRWYPYMASHTLDAVMPKGQWMSQLKCLRVAV